MPVASRCSLKRVFGVSGVQLAGRRPLRHQKIEGTDLAAGWSVEYPMNDRSDISPVLGQELPDQEVQPWLDLVAPANRNRSDTIMAESDE